MTSNFSFSHSVLYPLRELSSIFYQIWNCRLQTLSIWKSLKFVVWERVNDMSMFALYMWIIFILQQCYQSRVHHVLFMIDELINMNDQQHKIQTSHTDKNKTKHQMKFSRISVQFLVPSLNTINPIPTQWHLLTPLGNKPFENTVGKGEIARNEQFLLFPQCFLPVWITFCHFRQIWNCRLQTLSLEKSKICRLVMG